ncbi:MULTISPECIES: cell wall hydrolase [unclassified Neorhizobium]|uniref:cell wall hydrolase n=1 Tax=unclassified Neorhizobium TaxID=2629175 RepID=UPI001FF36EC6|nr:MULTISPECIES: cell wall hydrolase [unclassified Neorhizobium]MCJ9672070.1 cell wall hydrolase [Neorhizobium sp. SHOUNA12B]MCJ9744491.1 cell wall hydrolase [Neorhizobium sp. SHOUNA12A]
MTASDKALLRPAVGLVGMMLLSACTSAQTTSSISPASTTVKPAPVSRKQVYHYTPADRDCMKRAMYFESQRSSREGLMAVGTVIMNRLTSDAYPPSICGIVAQEKQFAPGVLTRPINDETVPELDAAVDAIIRGERNPEVRDAMFFHTAGLRFPYQNMHYVTVAGGNAFYEKRDRDGELQTPPPKPADEYVLALVQSNPDPFSLIQAKEFDVASIPSTGADPMVATNVPVPIERPDPLAVRSASIQPTGTQSVKPPVGPVILASSMSNEWMLRFDAGNAKPIPTPSPKRSPGGIDR